MASIVLGVGSSHTPMLNARLEDWPRFLELDAKREHQDLQGRPVSYAGLLALAVLGVALFWQPEMPERPIPRAAIAAGGDFTLQSAAGPVSLKDYRGKLVLVYFGYTFCPDICPTSLAATAEGLKQLTPEELARVAMIFVSVDPKRDTPERLKEYAEFFHPAIVGVTGTPEAIAVALVRLHGARLPEPEDLYDPGEPPPRPSRDRARHPIPTSNPEEPAWLPGTALESTASRPGKILS